MTTDRRTAEAANTSTLNGRRTTLSERAKQARRDYLEQSYRTLLESCAARNPEPLRPWGETSAPPTAVETRRSHGAYWRIAAVLAVVAVIVMNAPGGNGSAKDLASQAAAPESPAAIAAAAFGAEPGSADRSGAPEGDTVPTAYLPKKP